MAAAARHQHDARHHRANTEPLGEAWLEALRHREDHGQRGIGAGERGDDGDGSERQGREQRQGGTCEDDAGDRDEP